jgi:spermidine/putrescine transport system substrate-binding protein
MSNRRRQPILPPSAALDRRRFLGRGAAALTGLALGPALLAACGDDSDQAVSPATAAGGAVAPASRIRWSNWPAYIDPVEDLEEGGTTSLQDFEAATGISVAYSEDVQDNEQYFAKIREQLSRGQDIGADVFVVTDYLVARLIGLGWLSPLDKGALANVEANLLDAYRDVSIDPGRVYSVPYFSGFTSIAYNKRLVGRKLTSIDDLFDPAFRGQVTLLQSMRDSLGLVMLADGVDLGAVTKDDVERAAERVAQAKADGQIRAFTGNDYVADLQNGNIAVAIAYSGDVAQIQYDNPDIELIVPEEGMLSWSDNWVIPTTASPEAQAAVHQLIDFYYQPAVKAKITNWVQFIPPIDAGAELAELDPEVAENPLINPPEEWLAVASDFRALSDEEDIEFTRIFNAVIES